MWGNTVKMKVLESHLSLCSDKAHAGEEKEKLCLGNCCFFKWEIKIWENVLGRGCAVKERKIHSRFQR